MNLAHSVSPRSGTPDRDAGRTISLEQRSRRRIFLLPRHPTSWSRLLEQAEIMARHAGLQPIMVLANEALAAQAGRCREIGIDVIDVSRDIERRLAAANKRLDSCLKAAEQLCGHRERLTHSLPLSLLRLAQTRRRLRVEYDVFHDICRRHSPVAIFVPGDRELSPVPAMLRVGLDLGIPTILGWSSVPYGEGVELSRADFWRFRVALRDLPPLLNVYVAWKHSRQVRHSRFGRLLFSPGWLTLALASERMLSRNPWVQGGGNSRYLFHHSRRRMEHFVTLGVSEAKNILIGDPAADALYYAYREGDQIRASLVAAHGLKPGRKVIIVSVPNDFEHDVCDWPTHIARMDHYLGCLANKGAEILLSLHPKSKQSNYQDLANRYGFHFAKAPLARILPAADLFVCSGSSTVLWASLCGIPTINLDYLELDSADCKHPGILTVETAAQFDAALRRFVDSGPGREYGDLDGYAAAMRADSLFDGRAGERMCAFLMNLEVNEHRAA